MCFSIMLFEEKHSSDDFSKQETRISTHVRVRISDLFTIFSKFWLHKISMYKNCLASKSSINYRNSRIALALKFRTKHNLIKIGLLNTSCRCHKYQLHAVPHNNGIVEPANIKALINPHKLFTATPLVMHNKWNIAWLNICKQNLVSTHHSVR
jgi:hypothetical protein